MDINSNYNETNLNDSIELNIKNIKNINLYNDMIDNKFNFKKYNLEFKEQENNTLIYFDKFTKQESIKYLLNNFCILEITNNNNELKNYLILFNYSDENEKVSKIFLDDKNYFN